MWEKQQGQICPEVLYEEGKDGVTILGCKSVDGTLILPDEICGRAVTSVKAYAFSSWQAGKDSRIWRNPQNWKEEGVHPVFGEEVREVWLPASVSHLGRYAFYRCKNLKKLTLSDRLQEVGGGVFTGCAPEKIEIHHWEGEKNCLKSIVDEVRFSIDATLVYDTKEVQGRARVLFPEHYEEAVENTPARLLFTRHHGSGGYYRQCFYDRTLDYGKYDLAFFHAKAEEERKTTVKLAVNRLRFPFRLGEEAKKMYTVFVKEKFEQGIRMMLERADIDGIRFLVREIQPEEEALAAAVRLAGEYRLPEAAGYLLEEKRKQTKGSRLQERFSL